MSIPIFKIPEYALRLEYITPGTGESFQHHLIHEKTVSSTIIAQPTVGSYEITCQGRTEKIPTGEVFITGANQPLRIVHHGDPKQKFQMKARWVHFNFTLFETIDFTALFDLPLRAGGAASKKFGRIIEQLLVNTSHSESLLHVARRNILSFEMLENLCRLSRMRPDALESLEQSERLQPVLAYMKNNLQLPMSVDDLAMRAHMSSATLHRAFGRAFGLSPQRYLKRLRLSTAQRLLSADWTLDAIATQTGFASPFHFSREFKRATGWAPSEYRRRYLRMGLE
jgi:AraC-like DNA-binding protein